MPTASAVQRLTVLSPARRWHKKILKNNDPLIFSVGWRRFQSMPLLSLKSVVAGEERNRMIKYTPEHMHCFAQVRHHSSDIQHLLISCGQCCACDSTLDLLSTSVEFARDCGRCWHPLVLTLVCGPRSTAR